EYAKCSKAEITPVISSLLAAGVLVKETHRHQYYRISTRSLCEELQTLLAPKMEGRNKCYSDHSPLPDLKYCRSCHGHLAGWVGRRVAEQLQLKGYLIKYRVKEKYEFELTAEGELFFTHLGIDLDHLRNKGGILAKACLDFSERIHHLGGKLGVA